MKDNEISLYQCRNEDYVRILDFYNDPSIRKTFNGIRKDRVIAADAAYIIRRNETSIGFILLVPSNNDTYNIDTGILEQYRGNGYATIAMRLLRERVEVQGINFYVQAKKNNLPMNKSLSSCGFSLIDEEDNINYYSNNLVKQKASI